jgi:bifunctional non-homologous end joining protein LigD
MRRALHELPPFELAAPVEAKKPPAGPGWIHEIKHDGHRCAVTICAGQIVLLSRNHHDVTARFPVVQSAFARLCANDVIIDGEIACQDENGVARLDRLHEAIETGNHGRLAYLAFDLLFLDGVDLRPQPLLARKERLRDLLAPFAGSQVIYSDHLEGDPTPLFERICALGGEGIVSKAAEAPYRGGRDPSWVNVKCPGWAAEHAKVVERWNTPNARASGRNRGRSERENLPKEQKSSRRCCRARP